MDWLQYKEKPPALSIARLLTKKSSDGAQHLGTQVVDGCRDLLRCPQGIALLQGLKLPLRLAWSRCAINRDRCSSTQLRAEGDAEAVGDLEVGVLDLLNRARRHPNRPLREPAQPAAALPG